MTAPWVSEKTQQRQPGKLQFIGPNVTPWCQTLAAATVATARMSRSRVPITFKEDCLEFRLPVVGWYVTAAEVLTPLDKVYTVQASLELTNSVNNASLPVLWSGVQSKAVDSSITTEVQSDDWVAVNGVIPAGTHFLNLQIDVPTASMAVGFLLAAPTSGPFPGLTYFYTTPGAALNPVNGVGPLINTGILSGGAYMPAIFQGVLGRYAIGHPCNMGFGDSKRAGNGTTDPYAGTSAFSRAMYMLGIPELNLGISNSTAITAAQLPAYVFTMAKYFTDCTLNHAINDFTAGATAAQVQAAMTTIANNIKSINPNIRIWIAPTEPKVTIAGFTITGASTTGTVATMTVADATLLPAVGARVQVLGFTGASLAYNGVWTITAKDATTFSYTYQGTASGTVGTPTVNDAYATQASQTALFPTDRPTYNAWARGLGGGQFFGVLDPNVVAEAGGVGGSGKWAPYSTTDSLHPNDAKYTEIGISYAQQWLRQGGPVDNIRFTY